MFNVYKSKIKDFFNKGDHRTLLAKKNIAASFLIKAGGVVVGLLLVPITINYVNPTQYGIWLTLSSIVTWLSFFDIGLGNGLKNKLAEASALGEHTKGRIYISTTYALLLVISFVLFFLFSFINPLLNWNKLLNTPEGNAQPLNLVVLIIVGCFCISFVFQLINTILIATHKPAKSSLINLIGSFISLLVIVILTKTVEASLMTLVIVLAGIPLLIQIISSLWLFKTSLKSIAPSFKFIRLKYAKDLLSLGGGFFVIQISALVLFQTDNFIISKLISPQAVTEFNVAHKLFSVVTMIFIVILTPFWAAFTDAYAKQDYDWIKIKMKSLRKFFYVFSLSAVALFIMSSFLYEKWVGDSVIISTTLSLAMMIYVIIHMWQTLYVFLLNGIGKIRLQLYSISIGAVLNVPLAIYLGKIWGVTGIVTANSIVFIFLGMIYYFQCKKILENRAVGIWVK